MTTKSARCLSWLNKSRWMILSLKPSSTGRQLYWGRSTCIYLSSRNNWLLNKHLRKLDCICPIYKPINYIWSKNMKRTTHLLIASIGLVTTIIVGVWTMPNYQVYKARKAVEAIAIMEEGLKGREWYLKWLQAQSCRKAN